MEGFIAKIVETSRELSARERLMVKDTTNAISLDEATQNSPLVIAPKDYAVVEVHNDHSDNKDYTKYVIIDKDGNKYATGSSSFWEAFKNIYDEMKDCDEDYAIEIYRIESKNYKGKSFITCSIV